MTRARAWKVPTVSAVEFSEDLDVADQLVIAYVASPEDIDAADHLGVIPSLADDATLDDVFRVNDLRAEWADDASVNDLFKAKIINFLSSHDTYTDQDAPTSTNGSNVLVRVRSANSFGNGKINGYIAYDLTKFASFTSALEALNLRVWMVSDSVGTHDVVYNVYRSAAQPFDEATATWNSPPTLGTFIKTGTISVPQGTVYQPYDIPLTVAETTAALAQWVMVSFSDDDTVNIPEFKIKSKESATTTERPVVTQFKVQR